MSKDQGNVDFLVYEFSNVLLEKKKSPEGKQINSEFSLLSFHYVGGQG